ncbi:MAG: NAD(P)H-dependent glycerol-3-phosphate dehydrogenase [Fimbriimonadaceae bacterium]
MRVTVVGSGSWGLALALLVESRGHVTRVLGRNSDEFASLLQSRRSDRYLPGFEIPASIRLEPLDSADGWGDVGILAVPSQAVQETAATLAACPYVVIASKGIERSSGRLLSGLVHEACPHSSVVVLGGPNLALEVAQGLPAVSVVASRDSSACEAARQLLMAPMFRVYLSEDVVGVQVAGALKNVVAIAAGMSDGLGLGDNSKSAVVARGLNEMARVGVAMGARVETFFGAAGVGDLFATSASSLSRNYRVGFGLGQGRCLDEIVQDLGQVAEGVESARSAVALASRHSVPVPIMQVVQSVVDEGLEPRKAVAELMSREAKPEWPDLLLT